MAAIIAFAAAALVFAGIATLFAAGSNRAVNSRSDAKDREREAKDGKREAVAAREDMERALDAATSELFDSKRSHSAEVALLTARLKRLDDLIRGLDPENPDVGELQMEMLAPHGILPPAEEGVE